MEQNAVERAVQAVGGPSEASHVCGVSYWAIRMWRKNGIVPDSRAAILLSEATGGAVSVKELAGLANGNGDDGGKPSRFRKGGPVITATYQASSPILPIVPRFPDAAARAA